MSKILFQTIISTKGYPYKTKIKGSNNSNLEYLRELVDESFFDEIKKNQNKIDKDEDYLLTIRIEYE